MSEEIKTINEEINRQASGVFLRQGFMNMALILHFKGEDGKMLHAHAIIPNEAPNKEDIIAGIAKALTSPAGIKGQITAVSIASTGWYFVSDDPADRDIVPMLHKNKKEGLAVTTQSSGGETSTVISEIQRVPSLALIIVPESQEEEVKQENKLFQVFWKSFYGL